MKGKVIAAPTLGAVMHSATLYWLKKNGVDPSSVRGVEVPFPNMADQLKAGSVDAAEGLVPFTTAMKPPATDRSVTRCWPLATKCYFRFGFQKGLGHALTGPSSRLGSTL